MSQYLLLHAILSLTLMVLLVFLRNAPPRLRFRLAFLGVMLWAIPLPLFIIPVNLPRGEGYYNFFYELAVSPTGPSGGHASGMTISLVWCFVVLSLVGIASWASSLLSHYRQIRNLKQQSINGNHLWDRLALPEAGELRIIPGTGAMTTGILRPVIFIGQAHVEGDELESVLVHEATHIKQRDNAWIFGINLLERFFWWNPLLRFLATRARFYIELSCDQVCRTRLGLDRYRTALAEMMLRSIGLATPISSPLVAPLIALRKENIQRIKLMDHPYSGPWVSMAALVLFGLICTALIIRPVTQPGLSASLDQNARPELAPSLLEAKPETIARVGQLGVEPPVFTRRVAPIYPEEAVNVKIEGYVILEAILGADGHIKQVEVIRPLGEGRFGFEDAAISALQQWKYEPGKVDGRNADVLMTLKIDFRLE